MWNICEIISEKWLTHINLFFAFFFAIQAEKQLPITLDDFPMIASGNNSLPKVLIVEDNRDLAENIVDYLELKGFIAADGVKRNPCLCLLHAVVG